MEQILGYLKESWHGLLSGYSDDKELTESLWQEIVAHYTGMSRHYHNLEHIESMLRSLEGIEAGIQNRDLLAFAVWYHDLIYDPTRHDNEEQSAERAGHALDLLGLEKHKIDICKKLILVTKLHVPTEAEVNDEKYMIDLDLEVLSRDWEQYQEYSKSIRLEYYNYPEAIYRTGRRAALQTLLARDKIFYTGLYDQQKARENISRELKLLA
jgi:predicted metal-dependent HD superfamily phosphohydrolase